MKVAVIGHIEWATFATVDHLPTAGEIIHAKDSWQEPAGGGSVAAMQLAELADQCLFFTSVGDDEIGREAVRQLEKHGLTVYAAIDKTRPTRRVIVHIDASHERTITVLGEALKPSGNDTSLPWHELASADAVYFTQGDTAAVNAGRQAPVLVSTARVLPVLRESSIELDALVYSQNDPSERYNDSDLNPLPKLTVATNGTHGGTTNTGLQYSAELSPPDKFIDSYGCGDSFAAGLTFGLGNGLNVEEALKVAANCGAQAAQRRGAFQI
ncbi:MAG TPA: PfkB family carbohydrate kinase [Candidatus Saccharimonadales bacterium]|nr:PfkB family carbohydrate kinase [Candidatus Saccharimonadales bacterium]